VSPQVELDELSADALAHLAALKRARERGLPDPGPAEGAPLGAEPPDPETIRVFQRRLEQRRELAMRVVQVARDMTSQKRLLIGRPIEFPPEEVANSLVKVAIRYGLPRQMAINAVASGITLARGGDQR
jgi:hypothetical protein